MPSKVSLLYNGFAERYNYTLSQKAWELLQDSGLNGNFWGKTVIYECYLNNMTSSQHQIDATLFERLFGQ